MSLIYAPAKVGSSSIPRCHCLPPAAHPRTRDATNKRATKANVSLCSVAAIAISDDDSLFAVPVAIVETL